MAHDQHAPGNAASKCSCSFVDVAAMGSALAIAAVLQFAAVAKVLGPAPNKFLPGTEFKLDYAIGMAEMVVLMLLLALHRWKYAWTPIAVMFAGFAGYAAFWTIAGKQCGCFGKLWHPPLGVSLAIDIVFSLLALGLATAKGVRKPVLLSMVVLMIAAAGGGYGYAWSQPGPKDYVPPVRPAGGEVKPEGTGDTIVLPPDPDPATVSTANRVYSKDGITLVGAEMTLMASSLMEDIVIAGADGPAWMIMIYNPECHTCQEALDFFFTPYKYESEDRADEVLRVRMFSQPDLLSQLEIPDWAWEGTPSVLLVQDGLVSKQWYNEPVPDPFAVRESLEAGEMPE